jgi:hypothetical protein
LVLDGTTDVETVVGTGSAISFTAQTALGTYSVRAEGAAVCTIDMNGTADITSIPSPAPVIDGLLTPDCQEVGVVYTVTNALPGSTFDWTLPSGAVINGPVNTESIIVDFGVNGGNITVVETNGGCSGSASFAVSLLNCSFAADFSFDPSPGCIGSPIQFTNQSTLLAGTTFLWDFGTDASPQTSTLENPQVTFSSGGTFPVLLTITNGAEVASITKDVIVNELPTAVLSGGGTICAGGTATLSLALTGSAPWNFVYNDGGIDNDTIFNINNPAFDFSVNPSLPTTYTAVSVYNSCTNSASGYAMVDIAPQKDVTISVGSVTGAPNDLVKVPISVTGYQDLLTMQFTVVWDPSLVGFNSIQDFNLSNVNADINLDNVSLGYLTFSWFTENSSDTTIADGADIFSIAFDIQNTLCSDAPVSVDGSITMIEIGDSNGCIANVTTEDGNVEIQPLPQITSSIPSPICFGDTVVFTASPGGMTNYNFYLNGVSVQNGANGAYVNHDLLNLDSINVILTDPQGCTLPAQGIVMNVNQFSVTPTITDITSCAGTDGSITLSVTGGSGNYSFLWTGPSVIDASLQDQANLSSGFYSVTVTDTDNGCSQLIDFQLSDPVNFTVNVSKTDVSTTGGNDGSITLDIVGAGGPFGVIWTGPGAFASTDQNISNLFAGTYFAQITDQADGCTDVISVEITQPVNALILSAVKTDVTTCGAMDGTINLIVTGGSGSFSVSWAGPNSFSANTQNISGLEGGLYIATVTDLVSGITAQWTVQVGEPDSFNINAQVTDISYCSGTDGAISLNVTGGSGNFSYSWSDLSGLGFTSTDEDISGLALGTYRVIVTDNVSGCIDSLDSEVNM